VLVADLSYSVNENQSYIANALFGFVERFPLDKENGIQISLITFNGYSTVHYQLGDNKALLIQYILSIKSMPAEGTTNLISAIKDVMNEFNMRGRPDALKIVIVISDGQFDSPLEVPAHINALKVMFNSLIFGVLINGNSAIPPAMEQISSPGCYLSTNYDSLVVELQKLNICI